MKITQQKKTELTIGDLVTAAYQMWGDGRAANMLRLVTKARWVVFRGQPQVLISAAKGRVALLAILLGWVGFVNGAYGGEIVVGAPAPIVVLPAPIIVGLPVPGFIFGGDYDRGRDTRDYGRRGRESRGAAHGDRGGGRRR